MRRPKTPRRWSDDKIYPSIYVCCKCGHRGRKLRCRGCGHGICMSCK